MTVAELIQILEMVENKNKTVFFSFEYKDNAFHYFGIDRIKREQISASFDNDKDIILYSFDKPVFI